LSKYFTEEEARETLSDNNLKAKSLTRKSYKYRSGANYDG
jgi:hypothetical protein